MPFAFSDSVRRRRRKQPNLHQIIYDAGQKVEHAKIIAVLKSTKSIPQDAPVDENTDLNTIARLYEENLEKEEDELIGDFFPLGLVNNKAKHTKPQAVFKKPEFAHVTSPPEQRGWIKWRDVAKKHIQPNSGDSHGTSRLEFVEEHLKSEAGSSSVDSDSIISKKRKVASRSLNFLSKIFYSRKSKKGPENLPDIKRESNSSGSKKVREEHKRVAIRKAREKRRSMKQKHRYRDHLTYLSVLFVAILRIITTFLETHESDEHWILLQALLRYKKINCLAVYTWFPDLRPFVLYIYFLACCLLPVLLKAGTEGFCLVWMGIHSIYSGFRISTLPRRYLHKETQLTPELIHAHIAFFILDILCFTIVMIRYYHCANPVQHRDQYSNTLLGDYLVNDYIQFMVQSSFIRKKTAIQRATAFQVLTIIRKLKEKYRTTGTYPSQQTIDKEVSSAIAALNDWKKFPALRIIHAFELKEQLMNEKSRLRRERIREMKEKFDKMIQELQRQERLQKALSKAQKDKDKKVVMNELGYAAPATRASSDKTVPSVSSLTHDPGNLGLKLKGQIDEEDDASSRQDHQVDTANGTRKTYFEEREEALKSTKNS